MKDRPLAFLRAILKVKNLNGLLLSSHSNILFLTNYAGFSAIEREAFILVTKDTQYIITDNRYVDEVRNKCKDFIVVERKKSLKETLIKLQEKIFISTLGFEENNLTVSEYRLFTSCFKTLLPVDLTTLRIYKSTQEIEKIQEACTIGDQALSGLLPHIMPGMTEREIALVLETHIRKRDAEPAFSTIVAFGANSAIPHHHTDDTILKKNDVILLDFGVKYKKYCSDMSRTIFIGDVTNEQKHVYETVIQAQSEAIKAMRSLLKINKQILARKIDELARKSIREQGLAPFPHALGHGIGIDVHEAPTLSPKSLDELTEGMVFSIEPGIYLSKKFGVRIEDLFVIKNGKLLQLTHAPSRISSL